MNAVPRVETRLAALDTAAVSDALDSLGIVGALPGIGARVPGSRACGPAYTVGYQPVELETAFTRTFRNAADYLDDVPPGAVVVIDNGGSRECTNWGSLLTRAALARGLAGTVVHGSARDLREVRGLRYPLFSTGSTMVSGKNRVVLREVGATVSIGAATVRPGDLVLADDDGVLVVPHERAEEVVLRAERVEETERRIQGAIADGSRLDAARALHGYATPWAGRDVR